MIAKETEEYMRGIIGLDIGTTHIKSILFSPQGEVIREEKNPTPIRSDAYGSVYDPLEIWQIVEGQLKKLCAHAGGNVDGISITGMAEAGLIVNAKTGREETDILPWFETRTAALAAGIQQQEEAEIFKTTGLRNSFKYGIYKFLWFLEHGQGDRETAVWLSMCDYIAFKLTGQFVTEPGFAARTYVFDITKGSWDEERIEAYGLAVKNFPAVVPSGTVFGAWRWNGQDREIPVAIAGHDHICAAFGLLYQNREGICDSAGTSETYVGLLKEMPKEGFDFSFGILYGPFVDGGWFYMANVPSSGHSVEWFRKKLQQNELSYEEMNHRLSEQKKGPTGLLYFPYLTGMGSPWYEASMRGTLLGIRESDDGMTVLKAMMEGIQYQAAWLFMLIERAHQVKSRELVCAGGSVNNRVLMQMKADILNRKVRIPQAVEATLCGAAVLFYHKNAGKEAAERFLANSLRQKEVFLPDETTAEKYDRILNGRYLPLAEEMKKIYQKMWRE